MKTRIKIVRCALRELERSGLDQFTLRAVGSAAGLSATAVYRHLHRAERISMGRRAFFALCERGIRRIFGGLTLPSTRHRVRSRAKK
jgi:AcrR family transcriptional regulator